MSTQLQDKFQKLCQIVADLRNPESGCPWDLKQTHESLKPYLIEEAYEVLDAIEKGNESLQDELGDVLLQVLLHSQIAQDSGNFSIEQVVDALTEKLIVRHPHVFAETEVSSAEEVVKNWNEIKSKGRGKKGLLEGLGPSLPGLLRADKIGQKVASVGFDWENIEGVKKKVEEELAEFLEARHDPEDNREHLAEELGDLFFSLAQLGRKLGFHPELVLQEANEKFIKRFELMEQQSDRPLQQLSAAELEKLWCLVKKMK